ncbi:MAG TPA: ethylbenzene dehydrogenase-related protein [Halomonas sp.]|nr:ethylbenzene dehydrogenase-related protein [Halomonas sp.]
MRNLHMRRTLALALFIAAFALLWASNRQGVLLPDPERNISIPEELTVPLQMRAAYSGSTMHFQYRWPAERPHVIHDALRFENGKWVRYGSGVAGSEPYGLHEDRVAMMVDDGSVPEFGRYGGFITIGNRLDGFTDGLTTEDVEAHPYFGKVRGQDAATKYLPATRTDPADWGAVQPEERLAQLRQAGYFIDLWHWRSNRGGPLGVADDQVVAESRDGDAGRSAWSTNWDSEKEQPKFMFDPARAGYASLTWDDVLNGSFSLDSIHHLHVDTMVPFDENHAWKEDDTLPRRFLRDPDGSRGDIAATKHWDNGYWTVTMSRAMDTGNPLDDKAFHDGGSYDIAVSVHRHATGRRWHYVSLPIELGLGRAAELQAEPFIGDTPQWEQDWHEVTLFYPGQVNWPLLMSKAHAGAERIAQGIPVKSYHSPDQLAHYGVEIEYADAILTQWRLTLIVGLLLFFAIGFALLRGIQHHKN